MKKAFFLFLFPLFLHASELYTMLGVNAEKTALDEGKGISFGWGVKSVFENSWFVDIGFLLGYSYIEKDNRYRYGFDCKSGYKQDGVQIFALVSGIMQNYGIYNSAGFGYGGGVEYRFNGSSLGVGSALRHYDMTSEVKEYGFDLIQLYFVYYLH